MMMRTYTGRLAGMIVAALWAGLTVSPAVDVDWDGSGDPNAGGDWSTPANWDGNAVPGLADNARLLDVTTGIRTVTVDAPQTNRDLTMTQSTAGATNKLVLSAPYTLDGNDVSGTDAPFHMTAGAGTNALVLDFGGQTLTTTNARGVQVDLDGAISMPSGSLLDIHFHNKGGQCVLVNNGELIQNDSVVRFNWYTLDGKLGNATRKFINNGIWTLAGSEIDWVGLQTGGYGIMTGNENNGTMVVSNSTIHMTSLVNSGRFDVVDSSLGGDVTTGVTLSNEGGDMSFSGDCRIGTSPVTPNDDVLIYNGSATHAGSVFTVGPGTTVAHGHDVEIYNYTNNTFSFTGGALSITNVADSPGVDPDDNPPFLNMGTLQGAGSIRFYGDHNADKEMNLNNTGALSLTGVLELVDMDVNFGTNGTLAVQIAGENDGEFGALVMTNSPRSAANILDLSVGADVLDVSLVDGHTLSVGDHTCRVVQAESVVGVFGTTNLPPDGTWSVTYGATYIDLIVTISPPAGTVVSIK